MLDIDLGAHASCYQRIKQLEHHVEELKLAAKKSVEELTADLLGNEPVSKSKVLHRLRNAIREVEGG